MSEMALKRICELEEKLNNVNTMDIPGQNRRKSMPVRRSPGKSPLKDNMDPVEYFNGLSPEHQKNLVLHVTDKSGEIFANDRNDMEVKLRSAGFEKAEMEKLLQQQAEDISTLQNELNHYEKLYSSQKDLLLELDQQNQIMMEKHDDELRKIKEMQQNKIDNMSQNVVNTMTDVEQKLIQLNNDLDEKTLECSNESQRRVESEKRNQVLSASIEEFQKQAKMTEEIKQQKYKSLEDKYEKLQADKLEKERFLSEQLKLTEQEHTEKFGQLQLEYEDSKGQIEEFQDQNDSLKTQQKYLQALIEAKDQTISQHDLAKERITDELEQLQIEISLHEDKDKERVTELEESKIKLEKMENDYCKTQEKNEKLSNDLETLRDQVRTELGGKFEDQLKQKENEVSDLEEKLVASSTKTEELEKKVYDRETIISQNNDRLLEKDQIETDLRRNIELMRNTIEDQNQKTRVLVTEVENYKTESEAKKSSLGKENEMLKQEKAKAVADLDRQVEATNNIQRQHDGSVKKQTELEAMIKNFKQSAEVNELEIEKLRQDIRTKTDELNKMQTALMDKEVHIESLQQIHVKKLREMENKMEETVSNIMQEKEDFIEKTTHVEQQKTKQLKSQITELEEKLRNFSMNSENQQKTQEFMKEELETKYEKLLQENKTIKKDIEARNADISKKEKLLQDMQDSKRRMKSQMSAMALENNNIATSVQKLRQLYKQLQNQKDKKIGDLKAQLATAQNDQTKIKHEEEMAEQFKQKMEVERKNAEESLRIKEEELAKTTEDLENKKMNIKNYVRM
eukprot:UN07071